MNPVQPSPEQRRRVLVFRNLQADMATLFGDYRWGIKRMYPDVALQRVAAEMNADPDDHFNERNRPVRVGWPWDKLPSRGNIEMTTLQAQNWKRFWRKRLQSENLAEAVPMQLGAGRVRRLLRRNGINARLVKVLGSGGQGMISLWDINNRTVWRRVAIKSTALEGAVLEREKAAALTMKRAKHAVQLLRFNGDILLPKNDGSDETDDIASWQRLDDSVEIMCLEYMKNGDMFRFMARIGSAGVNIPNLILWKIFICLIKACVAMAHPPRYRKDASTGEHRWVEPPGTEDQAESELLPPGPERVRRYLAYNLVHFDLDPQNVMIGDFDWGEHAQVPIFKVGDFGLSRAASDPRNHSQSTAWGTRLRGKIQYLLPEQFTKEWDYINTWPAITQPRPKIAGQYGWHSNIWHIGVCMHMLITQAHWTDPPQAIGPLNDHSIMSEMFPSPFRVRNFDGQEVDPFYTYGAWLANPTETEAPIDPVLTMVLVRCLAAEPAHRPSLQELLQYARWRETLTDWRDSQEEIRAWSDEHISQAPIPPPEAPASTRTGLAAIGTEIVDRLAAAAELLRISGTANRADKLDVPQLRRAAPAADLRQRFREQGGAPAPQAQQPNPPNQPTQPDRPRRARFGSWWNNVPADGGAQLQNAITARVDPLPPQLPQPPLRRVEASENLRESFTQPGRILRRRPRSSMRRGRWLADGDDYLE